MKMIKCILSVLLSCMMVFVLVPIDSKALESNEFIVNTASDFTNAVDTINVADSGEFTIKLNADIDLNGDYTFEKNTITILGENHSIGGGNNGLLGVEDGAVLNLGTKDYSKNLTLKGGSTGSLVYATGKSTTVNMYDNVTLKDNSVYGSPGGVHLYDYSIMNMYGGLITNCNSLTFDGGGVYVASNSTLNMYGGKISKCSANRYGGGICCNSGSVNIVSGTISQNQSKYGGGLAILYVKNGWFPRNFKISKAEITDNTANIGGGMILYNSSTASTITKCTVTRNKATSVGGGIVLMKNSSADFSGQGNIICNNTADSYAADVYADVESPSNSIKLFDAATMNTTYQQSNQLIDGWYNDKSKNRYVPSENVTGVDVSKTLSSTATSNISLVASYKEKPKATVSYDLNGGQGEDGIDYSDEIARVGNTITVRQEPTKAGYKFMGWSDGNKTYESGDTFVVSSNTILTAQWMTIERWIDQNVDISVDFDVDVSVDTSKNVNAQLTSESKQQLSNYDDELVSEVLNGNDVEILGSENSKRLRDFINSSEGKVKIKLVIDADLVGIQFNDSLNQSLLTQQMEENEEAQIWEFGVSIEAKSYNGSGDTVVSQMDTINIHQLPTAITLKLTTGNDYTDKTVRVLYIHDKKVKTVESEVNETEVSIQAKEFSPYIILSKSNIKEKDSLAPKDPVKEDDSKNNELSHEDSNKDGEKKENNKVLDNKSEITEKVVANETSNNISKDKKASTKNQVKTVKTADDTSSNLFILMLIISGFGIILFINKIKYRKLNL